MAQRPSARHTSRACGRAARDPAPRTSRGRTRPGVLTACRSGTSSTLQPYCRNSSRRPRLTASPRARSSKDVKNCHGWRPPSSPMKSIGVKGPSSTSAAPIACRPGESVACRRSPVPIADLVVGLQIGEQSPRVEGVDVHGSTHSVPRNWKRLPSWKPRVKTFASTASGPASSLAAAGEVGVVALALPAEHGGATRGASSAHWAVIPARRVPSADHRHVQGRSSAIRSKGRPLGREGCRRVGQLDEEVVRGSSASSCTASRRRASTWKSQTTATPDRRGTIGRRRTRGHRD